MDLPIKNSKLHIIHFLASVGLYRQVRALSIFLNKYHFLRYKKSVRFFSKYIKKGDLCFDIGGCFGDITQIFLDLQATVVCVEPQQICLDILDKKFSKNKSVHIIPKAVSNKKASAVLFTSSIEPAIATLSSQWKNQSRFSKNFKLSKKQKTETTTLDDLIKEYGIPKFCKIDVEGFEKNVMLGLTQKIPFISFEFTQELLTEALDNMNYLSKLGSARFNCMLGGSTNLLFKNWQTKERLFEQIVKQEDKYLMGDIYARLN